MTAKKGATIGLVALLIFSLSSCASLDSTRKVKKLNALMTGAPDALTAVLEHFQTSDIVFIGGSSHRLLNESLFTSENLQRFYDAGVRYILVEGGSIDDDPLDSDEELQQIGMLLFYPWEYVGVRYTSRDWSDEREDGPAIYLLNQDKEGGDTLKMVGLETGRRTFIPGTIDPWELLDYRDGYMANMAFGFIDNAAPGEKFLVLAGGAHGVTERYGPLSNPEVWKPHGERFTSYFYLTLDEPIKMDPAYQAVLQSEAWKAIPAGPGILSFAQIDELVTAGFPVLWEGPCDWYIVDKTGIKGIMYSYALFKPEVLKEIIAQTKQYEADISILTKENLLNYEDASIYYNINDLLINVYYLRLFFGDYFPYDFWKPQMPLKDALDMLETLVFIEGRDPVELMRFPVPSVETMRDYHDHIELFASLDGLQDSNAEQWFSLAEPYMKKAHELFPYELWTDYWYVKMYIGMKDYGKAYEHIQTMLNDPLVTAMQIYPEVLELAALAAEHLGNGEQSAYRAARDSLTNEFGIDTSHFCLILSSYN